MLVLVGLSLFGARDGCWIRRRTSTPRCRAGRDRLRGLRVRGPAGHRARAARPAAARLDAQRHRRGSRDRLSRRHHGLVGIRPDVERLSPRGAGRDKPGGLATARIALAPPGDDDRGSARGRPLDVARASPLARSAAHHARRCGFRQRNA